jgi:hypothetical protein
MCCKTRQLSAHVLQTSILRRLPFCHYSIGDSLVDELRFHLTYNTATRIIVFADLRNWDVEADVRSLENALRIVETEQRVSSKLNLPKTSG